MAAKSSPCHRASSIVYSQNDVRFGKYFKSVAKIGKEVLFQTFVSLYGFINGETAPQTLTIQDYCQDTLGWSKTKIKETFIGNEVKVIQLTPNDPNFDCDVTLLYKLIVRTMSLDVPETLRKKIQHLKNLRNAVCHDDISMDKEEFNKRMEDLKSLCTTILQEVAQCTGTITGSVVKATTETLEELQDTELKEEGIRSYIKDVRTFRAQRCSSFISGGRQELKKLYSSLNVLNPFTLPGDEAFRAFTIENIFTKLVMESGDIEVTMSDLLDPSALKQRYIPRLVVLEGLMGSGKTSVCRFLLHEWCKQNSTLKEFHSFDIVIFLEVSKVSNLSFTSFLREQLLKTTTRNYSESDIVPLLQEMNLLFVVDGFDEATDEGKSVLREVFRKFTESRIIVTTRPEFTLEVKMLVDEHVIITVYGFNKSLRHEFAQKVFTILEKDEESRKAQMHRFMNYVNEMESILKSHLRLPLMWTLLLVLWRQNPEMLLEVRSATKLYQKLYSLCTLKLAGRLENGGQVHMIVLEQRLKQWQIKLGKVAFELLQGDTLRLEPRHNSHLIDTCGPLHLEPMQTLSSFLKCDVKEKLTGSEYCFSFAHRSYAEYLAAMFIADQVLEGAPLDSFFSSKGDAHRFPDLIIFVAGHLRLHGELLTSHAEELVKMIRICCGNVKNFSLLCQLVRETDRDPSVCHLLGNNGVCANETWSTTSTHPLLSDEQQTLLMYTTYAPEVLVIDIKYNAEPSVMAALPAILKTVSFHHLRTSIRLYLDNHYHVLDGDQGYPSTDMSLILARLIELDMFVDLMFHVDCRTAASLTKAKKLETLFARTTTLPALKAFVTAISQRSFFPLRWKSFSRLSFKKQKLKNVELLLDLKSDEVNPKAVPRIHWNGFLTIILVGISNSEVTWASELICNLVPAVSHNRLILQSSSITVRGARDLLKSLPMFAFRDVQIMSCHEATREELQCLETLWAKVRWGHGVIQNPDKEREASVT